MFRVYYILLLCFLFCCSFSHYTHAQSSEIDSLKAILKQNIPDSTRINTLNQLGKIYIRKKPENTIAYANKAAKLAKKNDYEVGLANSYSNKGGAFGTKGDFTIALGWHQKAFTSFRSINDHTGMASATNNMGVIYSMLGEYKKASENFQNALKHYEKIKDKTGTAQMLNNIGIVFKLQKQYKHALKYFEKSLKINQKTRNNKEIARCYNNIGLIYKQMKRYTKALGYYEKSLKISQQAGDKRGVAYKYHNMANIYQKQEQYDKATRYFEKSLALGQELHDKKTISTNLLSMSRLAMQTKKQAHALEFAKNAFDLSNKSGDKKTQKHAAGLIAKIYASTGEYEKAYKFHVIFKEKSDSLLNVENIRAIALKESQAKFAKDKEQQTLEMERQRQQKYAYISIIVFMLFLLAAILRSLHVKKNAHQKLQQKNDMIHLKTQEIEVQRDEILKKNDLLNNQHEELTLQKNLMLESIHYARELQQSVLPPHSTLDTVFKDHFVLFRPKDIVSGDFYWLKQFENHTFFAAADCTGHGIPGALMSMLAISCLNEIVNPNTLLDTGVILNELRDKIKYVLHQVNSEVEHKDGLDIGLCILDKQNQCMHFSGAYNPLYVIRPRTNATFTVNNQIVGESKKYRHTHGQEITILEVKGDRQPVGVFIRERGFTPHKIALEKGDVVYVFTDGCLDQLGGDHGKKFMAKNIKKVIMEHWQEPLAHQQQAFDKALRQWQGNHSQIDDILMIGLRP